MDQWGLGSSSHASEGQVNDIPNNSAINDDPNETSPENVIDNLDKSRSVHERLQRYSKKELMMQSTLDKGVSTYNKLYFAEFKVLFRF